MRAAIWVCAAIGTIMVLLLPGCASLSDAGRRELEHNRAVCAGNYADWDKLTDEQRKRAYWAAGRGFADLELDAYDTPVPDPWKVKK